MVTEDLSSTGNLHTNTIFIIGDEASMISNVAQEQNSFGSGNLHFGCD